jgi:hypothetical protein
MINDGYRCVRCGVRLCDDLEKYTSERERCREESREALFVVAYSAVRG